MRSLKKIAAVLFAVVLGTLGIATPAQASGLTVQLSGSSGYEFLKNCNGPGGACGTFNGGVPFTILVFNFPSNVSSVTLTYQVTAGTATAGVDFTGPLTGSVTIAKNFPQAWITVPLVIDGVGEPNETLQLQLTSSSVPTSLPSAKTGTIIDGGNLPFDCDLSRVNFSTISLGCNNRPAGQQWRSRFYCPGPNEWIDVIVTGNIVTGNGTSTASCPNGGFADGYGVVHVIV